MLKRIVCAALIAALFLSAAPFSALAGVNANYVLQVSQMDYIKALSGVEDTYAEWHAGMVISENMNAYQMQLGLDDLLERQINPMLKELEKLMGYSVNSGADSHPEFQQLLKDMIDTRNKAQTCRDIISSNRSYIYYQSINLQSGEDYINENEREAVAYAIIRRTDELKERMREAVEQYELWNELANRARSLMRYTVSEEPMSELKQHLTSLKAGYARVLNQRAAQETQDNQVNDADFIISVVGTDTTRIYAMRDRQDKTSVIQGATVKCWYQDAEGKIQQCEEKITNEEGYVDYNIYTDLYADEDGIFFLGYEVSYIGYRTQYVELTMDKGGKIFYAALEPNSETEDIYIAGVSLNGFDRMWNMLPIRITENNDEEQTIQVFLRSQSGSTKFSGFLTMNYIERTSGDACSVTKEFSSENPNPEFVDKWCSICAPEDDPDHPGSITFTILNSATNAVTNNAAEVKTEQASFDPEKFPSTDEITGAMIYPGTFVNMPDIRFLKNLSISCEPDFPYLYYYGLDGTFIIGASTYDCKWPSKLQEWSTHWKTGDQKEADVDAEKAVKEMSKDAKEIANGVKEGAGSPKKSKFIGEAALFWGFSILMCGKVEASYFDSCVDDMTLVFSLTAGSKGEWSRNYEVGPVPCVFTFGYSLSVTATLQTYCSYAASPMHLAIVPGIGDVHELKFTLDFTLAFYAETGPGREFNIPPFGKVKVFFGIRGSFSIKASLPLTQPAESSDEKTLTITGSLVLRAQCGVFNAYYTLVSAIFTHYFKDSIDDWDVDIIPFWDDSVAGAGRRLIKPYRDEDDEPEEEIRDTYQTDIDGTVRWDFVHSTRFGTEQPKFVNIGTYWGNYDIERVFAFWLDKENNEVKWWDVSLGDNGAEGAIRLSEESRKLFEENEDWRITGFAVSVDQQKRTVMVPPIAGGADPTPQDLQLGSMSIVYGKDFNENGIPQECMLESRLLLLDDGQLVPMQFYDEKTKEKKDVAFVYEIAEGYLEPETTMLAMEDACLFAKWEGVDLNFYLNSMEETVIYTVGNLTGDDTPVGVVYLNYSEFAYIDTSYDAAIIKAVASDNLSQAFVAMQTGDGEIHLLYPDLSMSVDTKLDLPAVSNFDIVTASNDEEKGTSEVLLFCAYEEVEEVIGEGEDIVLELSTPIQMVYLENKPHGYMELKGISDLDVDTHASVFYAGHFWKDTYLYWFDTKQRNDAEKATDTEIRLRAICFDSERHLMSDPFTMCVLEPEDGAAPVGPLPGYTAFTGPINAQMVGYDQDCFGTLYFTIAWMRESEDGKPDPQNVYSTYSVPWMKQAAPKIIGADGIDPAVSAGGSCLFDFTVLNGSNIPILGMDVGVYESGHLIEKVHVNLAEQEKSFVSFVDPRFGFGEEGVTFNGDSAVRRIDGLFDEINGDTWNVTRDTYDSQNGSRNGRTTELVELPVLMAEGIHTYRTAFDVPEDWKTDKYTITVKVDAVYTCDQTSSVFETDICGDRPLTNPIVVAINKDKMLKAGTLWNYHMVDFDNPDEDQIITTEDHITPISFKSDGLTLEPEIAELSIDYQLTKLNGEDCVVLTALQEGKTNNTATRGLTVSAWVDGEAYPSFTHTFNTHPKDGKLAYNIVVPVERMTGGRNASTLRVAVADTVEGNLEYTKFNNDYIFHLGSKLRFIRQPEDVITVLDSDAVFTAEAAGGSGSYSYQWQRFNGSTWVDVHGATDSVLILPGVTEEMGETLVRCVVKDSSGASIASNAAKLIVVQPVPPLTGDSVNPNLLAVCAAVCLALMIFLLRKRKSKQI